MSLPGIANGQVFWVGAPGVPAPFEVGSNWSDNNVPGGTTVANIDNGGIAQVGTFSGTVLALTLGSEAGTSGSVVQSGGSLTSTAGLFLATDLAMSGMNTAAGTYTLNNGAISGADFYIGSKGSGTFNMNGGTVTSLAAFRLGDDQGSTGVMNMTGGSVTVPAHFLVGHFSQVGNPATTGTLNMSGGTISAGFFNVAQHPNARGYVDHSGGTVIALNAMVVSEDSLQNNIYDLHGTGVLRVENTGPGTRASVYIASDGDGNQAGAGGSRGTLMVRENAQVLIDDHVVVGNGVGTNGTLQVSGGTVDLGVRGTEDGGGFLIIGERGSGLVEVSGGAVNVDFLQMGRANNDTSEGTVNQTGGTVTVRQEMNVGGLSGNDNAYSISAGALNVNTGLHVARFSVDPGGPTPVTNYSKGHLTVGGTANVTVTGGLFNSTGFTPEEGPNAGLPLPGGAGTIEVTGGTLSAGSFLNGGAANAGSFNGGGATANYVQSGGVATLGHVTGTGQVAVSGGAMNVSSLAQSSVTITGGTVAVAPDGTSAATSRVGTLAVSGSGELDLANNAMVVDYSGASPLNALRSAVAAGGIGSSLGANYAVGYAEASSLATVPTIFGTVDADAVLLRGTRAGDSNLDGTVNLSDFNALAANFGTPGGALWTQGDFNHDGLVNLSDFNRLAANFGLSAAGPDVTPQDWSTLAAAVPEPGIAAVGGMMAMAGLLRRRRR